MSSSLGCVAVPLASLRCVTLALGGVAVPLASLRCVTLALGGVAVPLAFCGIHVPHPCLLLMPILPHTLLHRCMPSLHAIAACTTCPHDDVTTCPRDCRQVHMPLARGQNGQREWRNEHFGSFEPGVEPGEVGGAAWVLGVYGAEPERTAMVPHHGGHGARRDPTDA